MPLKSNRKSPEVMLGVLPGTSGKICKDSLHLLCNVNGRREWIFFTVFHITQEFTIIIRNCAEDVEYDRFRVKYLNLLLMSLSTEILATPMENVELFCAGSLLGSKADRQTW